MKRMRKNSRSVVSSSSLFPLGAEQAAEKDQFPDERPERRTSGAKAHIDSIGFLPGINPRPTARMSFSADCGAPFNFWDFSVRAETRTLQGHGSFGGLGATSSRGLIFCWGGLRCGPAKAVPLLQNIWRFTGKRAVLQPLEREFVAWVDFLLGGLRCGTTEVVPFQSRCSFGGFGAASARGLIFCFVGYCHAPAATIPAQYQGCVLWPAARRWASMARAASHAESAVER